MTSILKECSILESDNVNQKYITILTDMTDSKFVENVFNRLNKTITSITSITSITLIDCEHIYTLLTLIAKEYDLTNVHRIDFYQNNCLKLRITDEFRQTPINYNLLSVNLNMFHKSLENMKYKYHNYILIRSRKYYFYTVCGLIFTLIVFGLTNIL